MAANRPHHDQAVHPREILGGRIRQDERVVLVVDDEPDIRTSLKLYLSECLSGVRVETAPDGVSALERMDRGAVDVLVSDHRMPGMEGLDLLRRVVERCPDTACILLTAYPDLDLALAAVNEIGVHRFLTKPVDPLQLVSVTYDLLQERRADQERTAAFSRALELLREASGAEGPADPEGP